MVKTVLIVDDDPECVRLLTLLLEREGFQVLSVFSGEEAIRTLENEVIDLVSLDVILPDVNGLDLCLQIQKMEQNSAKPIVLLSARATENDLKASAKAGAEAYLHKATQISEWVCVVGDLLEPQKTERKAAHSVGNPS